MTYSVTLAEAIRQERGEAGSPPDVAICALVTAVATMFLRAHGYTVTPPAPEPVDPRSDALARALAAQE